MEQIQKSLDGMTLAERNRATMSPANYLAWLTERMSERERDEIYKRKLGIVEQMTSAVNGPLSLDNNKIDIIVAGEVPPETVKDWIRQELEAKKGNPHVVLQQIRQETAMPHVHGGSLKGNYNADIVARAMEERENSKND